MPQVRLLDGGKVKNGHGKLPGGEVVREEKS
jgi:hypothetical protein